MPWNEGDDKLCAWHPKDFGAQLQRLSRYQQAVGGLTYNEIIIDGEEGARRGQ